VNLSLLDVQDRLDHGLQIKSGDQVVGTTRLEITLEQGSGRAGVAGPKDSHLAKEIPSRLADRQEARHAPTLFLDEELRPVRIVV
jgi:hypothetical protein